MSKSVNEVFSEALGIALDLATDSLEYNSIKEWDSVAHMSLVAALEEAYDIMLETDDVIDMSSIARAKEILAKYEVEII